MCAPDKPLFLMAFVAHQVLYQWENAYQCIHTRICEDTIIKTLSNSTKPSMMSSLVGSDLLKQVPVEKLFLNNCSQMCLSCWWVDILTWTILPQDCLYLEPSPSVLDNLENAQLNILDDYYLLSILSKRELMYFLRILWILILAHQCQNERTLIFSLWLIYLNNVPIVHIQHSRDRGGAGPGPYVTLFHSHRYSSW